MTTSDAVRVADGVELPVDVAAALDRLDAYFHEVAAEGASPLTCRSRERGAALVAADYARRKLTAGVARVIAAADRDGDFVDDGHRAVRPWVNAHVNTSRSEAWRDVQVAKLGVAHPLVLTLLDGGALGVAQSRLLAAAYANPRIAEAFDASVARLVDLAMTLSYDLFADELRMWVQLVDADGAHRDHEAAHAGRRAHVATVGETTYLDAAVGTYQGAELTEILDRFTDAEYRAEWDSLKAIHGEAMGAALLTRTSAQRRADALVTIFRTAAGANGTDTAPEPVVNIVIAQHVFEEQLAAAVEGRRARFDPTLGASWCATTVGLPIDPADAVAAALVGHVRRVVIDAAGVVIGFGRRRRLFTGSARKAAEVQFLLQTGGRCMWPGCGRHHCQHDHTHPYGAGGDTDLPNVGPGCGWHNRIKNHGYRTWRDPHGQWHTARPDGTAITPA